MPAFEKLISRYERRIYWLARRITGSEEDAQDATQQAFLDAMQGLAGFREKASFSTWLTTIAANAAMKLVRKRRGLSTMSLDEATTPDEAGQVPHPEYIADWRETPDKLAQDSETSRLLDDAIAGLAPDYRAVFMLRDVEGLSVKDTAMALKTGEGNVKVRLLRARLLLREKLTAVFGDEHRTYKPVDHGHGEVYKTERGRIFRHE